MLYKKIDKESQGGRGEGSIGREMLYKKIEKRGRESGWKGRRKYWERDVI